MLVIRNRIQFIRKRLLGTIPRAFFLSGKFLPVLMFLALVQTTFGQGLDTRVLLEWQRGRQATLNKFSIATSNSVYYGVIGTPVVLWAHGLLADNSASRRVGSELMLGTVITTGLVWASKYAIGRERPFVSNSAIVPLQTTTGSSFPSGHTAVAFNTATTMSLNYPHWYVAVPYYSWAVLVGASRVYNGVHYPSDVAVGALLGISSSIVTHYCCKHLFKQKRIQKLLE